jgi:hypothetical protein
MKSLILGLLFILSFSFIVKAQNSKKEAKNQKKEAAYREAIEIVGSESYQFTGRKANPQRGPQIDLSTRSNFLRINKGTATAEMPYFGRAFSGGYSSSDGGIRFDGPMETYDVQKNDKKHRLIIKFTVKGSGDTYTCTLTVLGKESASLNVISNKRQSINYTGTIEELREE